MANALEFFESLGKSISRTADRVVKKTDEFVAIQKIKNRISSLEQKIDRDFREIGETVYRQNKNGKQFSAEIDKVCGEVSALRKDIAACKEEIAARKGEKICWACGSSIPKEARFCMQCGKAADAEPADSGRAGCADEEEPDFTTGAEQEEADDTIAAEPVAADILQEVEEDGQ